MSDKELQKVYKIEERIDAASGKQLLFILPQDIIDNTIKAFSTSATSATGYGSLGAAERPVFRAGERTGLPPGRTRRLRAARSLRHGPKVTTFDLSVVKRITLVRAHELPVPGRDAQRVQQHQLHTGGADRQQRDAQPGDGCAARRQQHAEPRRTSRAVCFPCNLLTLSRNEDAGDDSSSPAFFFSLFPFPFQNREALIGVSARAQLLRKSASTSDEDFPVP